ncbi:hypothetical protein ACFSQ7_15060 [Paenibacillus rhizoplanae]
MRKAASFAIALTVVTGLLAGCSKGNSTNSAVKEDKGNGGTQTEQASKDVKLTFFNTSAEVNTVFEELFKKYHEQNPQVTIELIPTPIGGAQLEKFQSLLASGNPATIVNLDAGTILQYKDDFS